MKKIFIAIAAVAAVAFASCDGNATSENGNADTTEVAPATTDDFEALEEAVKNGDENAINAQIAKIQEMIANADSSEIKKYAYKLQEFAANHKGDLEKFTNGDITIDDLVSSAKGVKELASDAKGAAVSDANKVNEQAKEATEAAKETIKETAKEKANEAADAAAQKASEEASKAVNNAADALKKKFNK